MKLANLLEKDMIKRLGFGAQGYDVGASLKSAFAEWQGDDDNPGATDNYAEQIQKSDADLKVKDDSLKLLNSIKSKGEDITTLLSDFNFDDKSAIGAELYRKLSGETDEGEEDTLRWYDFQIDSSIKSGMFENVVGLLDELDSFFYVLIGMLGASGKQKPEPKPMGFREVIEKTLGEDFSNSSIDYTPFFEKIIKRLEDLDVDLDYLTAVMAKTSPSTVGWQQRHFGKAVPTSRLTKDVDEHKLREVIKREIKSLKNTH